MTDIEDLPNQTLQNMRKTAQKFLDTVVDQIKRRQEKSKDPVSATSLKYPQLYKNIKDVLQQFDLTISDCKKYNQAKIHRKYEIKIADLEQEIKILQQKVDQQQRARSPSKKYVEKLVDQLVFFKNDNQKLKKQIQRLKQSKLDDISKRASLIQQSQSPRFLKSNPQQHTFDSLHMESKQNISVDVNSQVTIADNLNEFLKIKHSQRRIRDQKKSPFEIFLKKSKSNFGKWNFTFLLDNIDEWSKQLISRYQGTGPNRLKSNILSSLQDQILMNRHAKLPKIYTGQCEKPKKKIGADHFASVNSTKQVRFLRERERRKNVKYHSTIQVSNSSKYRLM